MLDEQDVDQVHDPVDGALQIGVGPRICYGEIADVIDRPADISPCFPGSIQAAIRAKNSCDTCDLEPPAVRSCDDATSFDSVRVAIGWNQLFAGPALPTC